MEPVKCDYKLALANYVVDGKVEELQRVVSDVKEGEEPGLFTTRTLEMKYYHKKLFCVAKVTFASDNPEADLYKAAVTFIRRLK